MFNLTEVSRYHLGRAPLVRAIAQVRFPLVAHLQTLPGIAPLQDRLRPRFPVMEQHQVQEMTLAFGPSGPQAPPQVGQATNWVFSDENGAALTLAAGAATLTASDEYNGIEEFADLFEFVLGALAETESPPRCDRLGIRYVNAAEVPPGEEQAWAGWFRPELIGWIGAGLLSESSTLVSSVTQTNVSAPPTSESGGPGEIQGLVRHGFVPSQSVIPDVDVRVESSAYLLDIDMFVPVPQRFDVTTLMRQFRALHSEIDRFFRWTLTDEGARYFELEEVPA